MTAERITFAKAINSGLRRALEQEGAIDLAAGSDVQHTLGSVVAHRHLRGTDAADVAPILDTLHQGREP